MIFFVKKVISQQWQLHKVDTIRGLIIEHGASIKFVEGICTIRIYDNYPYKSTVERILGDMRTFILTQDYLSNYMISQ